MLSQSSKQKSLKNKSNAQTSSEKAIAALRPSPQCTHNSNNSKQNTLSSTPPIHLFLIHHRPNDVGVSALGETSKDSTNTTMQFYTAPKLELSEDEVFVFGANLQGFHGAGAAGYATFHEFGNLWRKYNYHKWPRGKQGYWNVKGKLGPQIGTHGKSYALPTIATPGAKRSLPINFKPLYECCNRNPKFRFYLAQSSRVGLNGWTPEEIVQFMTARDIEPIPPNLAIDQTLAEYFNS